MKYAKIDGAHSLVPVGHSRPSLETPYKRFGKRTIDLCLAVILLPIVAPVILALGAVVRRDGAPGLFGHLRVGKDGRRFRCWKIRTMVADAERHLSDHLRANPELARMWERDFKLDADPRITPFGRFLRKTSLDELPQIWNVLCGDMSFVGPRPVVPEELSRYGEAQRAYLALRPGITGQWQVSGRNSVSYAERVRMDADYLNRLGFWTDLRLLGQTALAVLGATGK